ncbi:Translin [Umbelopsis sp. PMI_123]|nr:Translin [Umbelopsis sp. PMI_123]
MSQYQNANMAKLFEIVRESLDAHHDKRERLIKLVRDITAQSKKLIFLLHRTAQDAQNMKFDEPLAKRSEVLTLLRKVSNEVNGSDYYRYLKSVSPGIEEYIEAAAFFEYLEHSKLLTMQVLRDQLLSAGLGESFIITDEDYLNGIGDLTGELMRYAINSIGAGHHDTAISVCHFMQEIYKEFEVISATSPRVAATKLETMKASLSKVEQACYSYRIRRVEDATIPIIPQKRTSTLPSA